MTVARAVTHADGRTDAPLIGGCPVPATYGLRFRIGEHFRRAGSTLPEYALLDVVQIRFGVAEPEGPYHAPSSPAPGATKPIADAKCRR